MLRKITLAFVLSIILASTQLSTLAQTPPKSTNEAFTIESVTLLADKTSQTKRSWTAHLVILGTNEGTSPSYFLPNEVYLLRDESGVIYAPTWFSEESDTVSLSPAVDPRFSPFNPKVKYEIDLLFRLPYGLTKLSLISVDGSVEKDMSIISDKLPASAPA